MTVPSEREDQRNSTDLCSKCLNTLSRVELQCKESILKQLTVPSAVLEEVESEDRAYELLAGYAISDHPEARKARLKYYLLETPLLVLTTSCSSTRAMLVFHIRIVALPGEHHAGIARTVRYRHGLGLA